MHQDRNNGIWPELKRKKQRLAFDDDIGSKSHGPLKNFTKESESFSKAKKIKANNLSLNDESVMNEFTETDQNNHAIR